MISVEDEIRLRSEIAMKAFNSIVINSSTWTEAISLKDANMVANGIVDNAILKSLNIKAEK